MVVKSKRGRRRYVAFEVPCGTGRDELSSVVDGCASAKVITCYKGLATVRCSPEERDPVVNAVLEGMPGSRSITTSGTLRTLRDEYPELRVPRKRKK